MKNLIFLFRYGGHRNSDNRKPNRYKQDPPDQLRRTASLATAFLARSAGALPVDADGCRPLILTSAAGFVLGGKTTQVFLIAASFNECTSIRNRGGTRMWPAMFVAAGMFAICFGVTAYSMREDHKRKDQAPGFPPSIGSSASRASRGN
jgi:hypothetical protein